MAGRHNGGDVGAGGDYKRDEEDDEIADGEETPAEKRANEYVRALLSEKLAIDRGAFPLAAKLIDQEITRAQTEGRGPKRDSKYVDVYREKPAKVSVKVLVPLKEHPKFNFVGKLLGPKGNSLKRLQEDTMCRMAILGRGSMRDKDKEEELRKSLDLKYAHLSDDLHVEVSALGPPAEAYARIAFALTEVQKYLIPDGGDDISKSQLQEMGIYEERPPRFPRGGPPQGVRTPGGRPPGGRPPGAGHPNTRSPGANVPSGGAGPMRRPGPQGGPPSRPGGPPMRPAPRGSGPGPRGPPNKGNVMSILDRARVSMEDSSYGGGYDEPYEPESAYEDYSPSGPSRSGFGGGGRFGASDYDADFSDTPNDYSENQRWRPYKPGGPASRPEQPRFRSTPYARPGK